MLTPAEIRAVGPVLSIQFGSDRVGEGWCPIDGEVVHRFRVTPDGHLRCDMNHHERDIERAARSMLPMQPPTRADLEAVAEAHAEFGNFEMAAAVAAEAAATPVPGDALRRLDELRERRAIEAGIGPEPPPLRLAQEGDPADLAHGLTNDFTDICRRLRSAHCRALLFDCDGELRFDELRNEPVQADPHAAGGYRLLPEAEIVDAIRDRAGATMTSDKQTPARWQVEDIKRAISRVSREKRFHPVREWLDGLKAEAPGTIEKVCADALHVTHPLVQQMVRRFLIGAVARAYRPAQAVPLDAQTIAGVDDPAAKVDQVLVLQSAQHGRRKGLFLQAIGGKWYQVVQIDPSNKDTHMNLRGVWIAEWAEMAMHTVKEWASLNAFVTTTEDRYRAPYASSAESHPRRVVIAATTNKWDFLRDPNGQFRRWWPVEVDGKNRIEVSILRDIREPMWAEAVEAYKDQQRWWFEPDEEAALGALHEKFRDRDTWEEEVLYHAVRLGEVTVRKILSELGMPLVEQDKVSQKRVESVLQAAKWRCRGRVWLAPGLDT